MKLSYIESKIFGKVCYGFRQNNDGIVETIPDKAKVVTIKIDNQRKIYEVAK